MYRHTSSTPELRPNYNSGGTVTRLPRTPALSSTASGTNWWSETAQAAPSQDIKALFAAIRDYAAEQHISVLELLAEHILDDLPFSIGYTIRDYVEERKPKVKPGEVELRTFFASGRSDISERMEEIIYGPDPDNNE